jgi:Zn-dependent protease
MTVNPLKHLDPLGVLCMIVAGFGWAHPVPVDSRNLRKPKRDMVLISLAGPASNILLAFLGVLLLRILLVVCSPLLSTAAPYSFGVTAFSMLLTFLMLFSSLNSGLAIFNLLPIPPLDGSHLLALILPTRVYFKYVRYERYISFALVLLLVFDVLDTPLFFLRSYLLMGLEWIVGLIPFL